jgi:hypothetical protein
VAFAKAGRYLQHSIRIGGRVSTEYYGMGHYAADLATMDVIFRAERDRERLERLAVDEEHRRLYDEEQARGVAVRRMVAVILTALGFVRYARNPWRRRAMRRGVRSMTPAVCSDPGPPPVPAEVEALVKRTSAGEKEALWSLCELAKVHPRVVVDATTNDLCWCARTLLADHLGNGDKAQEIGIETRLELIAADLAGEGASLALQLCAEVVAFSWLEYWTLSAAIARGGRLAKTTPIEIRRQNAAHRRFLASLRTFTQIASLEGRGGTFADLFK